jgi:hypothetical protein
LSKRLVTPSWLGWEDGMVKDTATIGGEGGEEKLILKMLKAELEVRVKRPPRCKSLYTPS